MRILEQILEEIEDEMRCYREISSDGRIAYGIASREDYKRKGIAEGLQKAIRIIHTHMEDDGWIPVEERLPEAGGRYLAVFGNDDTVHLLGYGNCQRDIFGRKKGFGWYDLPSGNYFAANAVKAWRPLPGPYQPKEEKR